MKKFILILPIVLFCAGITFAQNDNKGNDNSTTNNNTLNFTDKNGHKQGYWKKSYQNGKPAYEAYFKDDKPVGEHKRYHMNGKLNAVMKFDAKTGIAKTTLYDKNGILQAKGYYKNKLKDSVWQYYKGEDIFLSEETYSDGKKQGKGSGGHFCIQGASVFP